MSEESVVRTSIVREMGLFCAAYRMDTLKLFQEIHVNWPDATSAEVQAALDAGAAYSDGAVDE